jgi:hypothetical protein
VGLRGRTARRLHCPQARRKAMWVAMRSVAERSAGDTAGQLRRFVPAANRRLAAMALPAVGRLGHFAFDEITRHRLSRGGDRAANNAPHRIALVRMSAQPANPRLRPTSTGQRSDQQGDSAAAQTSHRPRNIQTADPTHPIDEYRGSLHSWWIMGSMPSTTCWPPGLDHGFLARRGQVVVDAQ